MPVPSADGRLPPRVTRQRLKDFKYLAVRRPVVQGFDDLRRHGALALQVGCHSGEQTLFIGTNAESVLKEDNIKL